MQLQPGKHPVDEEHGIRGATEECIETYLNRTSLARARGEFPNCVTSHSTPYNFLRGKHFDSGAFMVSALRRGRMRNCLH